MAFTHSVTEKIGYVAGGNSQTVSNTYSKTGGAEINLSEEVVTNASDITTPTIITGFNGPDTAASIQSLLIQWDQTASQAAAAAVPSGYLSNQSDALLCNVIDGEPVVWVEGNTEKWGDNFMTDAITSLKFQAHTGGAVSATGTLTVRCLYEP